MRNKLMTHVVAGYPTAIECERLLFGMQASGVCAIEIQIPFSDPSADGPTIMKANDVALVNGTTVSTCFELIHRAREKGLSIPIYIMSYANKLFHFGIEQFCQDAKRCHVTGLIVPDLPPNSPEYKHLTQVCLDLDMELVPVVSPGTSLSRLSTYDIKHHKLLYITSTRGITGKKLTVSTELIELVQRIRSLTSAQIALGFGIRTPADVKSALEIADVAVIGSGVIEIIQNSGIDDAINYIKPLVESY